MYIFSLYPVTGYKKNYVARESFFAPASMAGTDQATLNDVAIRPGISLTQRFITGCLAGQPPVAHLNAFGPGRTENCDPTVRSTPAVPRSTVHGLWKKLWAVAFLLVLLPAADASGRPVCAGKEVIGRELRVLVEEFGAEYLARVDTGATTTSIHATDQRIINGGDDPRDNVGKMIRFRSVSSNGKPVRMKAEIARVQTVVNAQGREKRYMVWLTLSARGVRKKVLVNLRDRSHMRYKLLVGRDWLAGDFLVDVGLGAERRVIRGEEE